MLSEHVQIITPSKAEARGAQLSLTILNKAVSGKGIHEQLLARGIIVDWREPNVIRISPTPLYNSFVDVFQFVKQLSEIMK